MDLNLNEKWSFWYHDPYNCKWTIDSYKKILDIKTIRDFAKINNSWDILPNINKSMYFLMKIPILPIWEDKHNIKGGLWSFKIIGDDAYILDVWTKLSIYLLGESLLKNINNELINGISVSRKKNFSIIKLWCKTDCVLSEFNDDILELLEKNKAIYKPHNENIINDTKKKFKNKFTNKIR